MTQHDKAICVYAASSDDVDNIYKDEARQVGRLIAEAGATLSCGAGKMGLMAAAIDGALEAGGKAVGIIPEFMVARQWHHEGLTETIVTADMHSRKKTMLSTATAVIALAGGVGTLEELLEAITWRQLGLFHGNIVIFNQNHYYDPLLKMLDSTIANHFMRDDHTALWQVATTPARAVEMALATDTHPQAFSQKIK